MRCRGTSLFASCLWFERPKFVTRCTTRPLLQGISEATALSPMHFLWPTASRFPGGVGNTRGSAENFATLIDDVEKKLFDRFDDDTWVYPGHGSDTTLGVERPSLGGWRERGW